MNPQERIAQAMRVGREDAGLSQQAMADRLGIDIRSYRRWENGESYGYLHRIAEIAHILDVPESELLAGVQPDDVMPPREALNAKLDLVMEQLQAIQERLERHGLG